MIGWQVITFMSLLNYFKVYWYALDIFKNSMNSNAKSGNNSRGTIKKIAEQNDTIMKYRWPDK